MKKSTKILIIAGVAVDVTITVFLFIISIIMLAMIGKWGSAQEAVRHVDGLILYLLQHVTLYFWAFVFPLFVLLAGNILGLVFYVKKTSSRETPAQLNDLSEEQKEALRQELLKDLMKGKEEEKPADSAPEAPKEEAPVEDKKDE